MVWLLMLHEDVPKAYTKTINRDNNELLVMSSHDRKTKIHEIHINRVTEIFSIVSTFLIKSTCNKSAVKYTGNTSIDVPKGYNE